MGVKEEIFSMNKKHHLMVYVYYRGGWCTWCQAYAKTLERELLPHVKHMDGDLVFISSESPERAEETAKDWNCESKFMGDPSNEFAHMHSVKIESRDKSPAKDNKNWDYNKEYPNGFAQPAIIAYYKEKAVFRWTMKPTKENLDGAADRPVPTDLFAVLRTIVQGKTLEGMQMHPYDSHELKKAEPRLYQNLHEYYQKNDHAKLAQFEKAGSTTAINAEACHLQE